MDRDYMIRMILTSLTRGAANYLFDCADSLIAGYIDRAMDDGDHQAVVDTIETDAENCTLAY